MINFHLPFDSESYTHRIGRTGRAGKSGKAVTLVTTRESRALMRLKGTSGMNLVIAALPTKKEVMARREEDFLKKIIETEIHPDAEEILEKLLDTEDKRTIALKLLSNMLDKTKISGPEKIGKTPAEWSETPPSRGGREGRGGRGGYSSGRRDGYRGDKGKSNASSSEGRRQGNGAPPKREGGGNPSGKPVKKAQRFRNR